MTHRRAVSPVIATVILIAVAVAIGIAVAFWASGLTGSFSKYEKLGINTGYATPVSGGWVITLQGDNSGSSTATVVQVQVNGIPLTLTPNTGTNPAVGNAYIATAPPGGSFAASATVQSGGTFRIYLQLATTGTLPAGPYSPGQTVEVALVSASGTNYPKAIVLP